MEIFTGQGGIEPQVEEDIRHEIALVGAIALTVADAVQDRLCPVGEEKSLDVISVIPYIAETPAKYFAGIDLTGLREHQVQATCVTGDQSLALVEGPGDQVTLQDVLRSLDAGSSETVRPGRILCFEVFLQAFYGMAVFTRVYRRKRPLGKVAAHQGDRMGINVLHVADKIDNAVHLILVI